jgi:mono/diheme cytochrome c family protein
MIKTPFDLKRKQKQRFINSLIKQRMKKLLIITGCAMVVAALASCDGARRNPGHAYMPDMSYSVAYESYASTERLQKEGAFYIAKPVPGTIARGDMPAYNLTNDSTGYAMSASVKNPYDSFPATSMKEAERLYLVNCAICHGAALDGNGPLYKGGDGPYAAKPAQLVGDPAIEALSTGTMFHVATYGKGAMGSYASQLSTEQRWMVVTYIKGKQSGGKTPAASADSAAAKPVASQPAAAAGTAGKM